MINPATGQEIMPVLTSTPSSGYVTQPPPKVISPVSPINSNGYVTHSMLNVS